MPSSKAVVSRLLVLSVIAGLLVGALSRPRVAAATGYCEHDACYMGRFCFDTGTSQTGCDILGGGGCMTYGCEPE
jgi:hypothetical protein